LAHEAEGLEMAGLRPSSSNASGLIVVGRSSTQSGQQAVEIGSREAVVGATPR